MHAKTRIFWLGATVAAIYLAIGSMAWAGEGYDPLRQITTQIPRSNLLCLLDVSGSMAWDLYGNYVGVNSVGSAPASSWSKSYCSSTCKKWTYTLKISQALPSRMNTVKNALGNSVSIYSEWAPSATYVWPSIQWKSGTVTGPVLTVSTNPLLSYSYAWTVTYSSAKSDPGAPYLAGDVTNFISAGTGGQLLNPMDLIGTTGGSAGSINWGLATFSTYYANCSSATLNAKIDSYDSGDVTAVESALMLQSAGGLDANGSTPTIGGLTFAKNVMSTTFSGGTITDYQNHPTTVPKDPKQNCGRVYGVVLVTDGLSNYCNPGGGNWISPCPPAPCSGPGCCDGGSSGYNCPDHYTLFAAGVSEAIWNLTAPLNPHVWTIGVSNQVGKCELNYTAYKGRGDAAASDAGVNAAADAYLPPGAYDSTRDYAFFATNALALKAAFDKIIAGLGAGNYTTAAPSISASSPSTSGNVALMASTEYPAWKGHLYAYDLDKCDLSSCDTTTFPTPDCAHCTGTVTNPIAANPLLLWDAGQSLEAQAVGTDHTNGRSIWTWNPSSNSLVEITATNLATLNSICGGCGLTAQTVDFIRGNNGSGVKRSWLLGNSINSVPAIVAAPSIWKQGTLGDHSGFEQAYGTRHPLVWLGADDGMLHAFDIVDGAEVVALIPPELLGNQTKLYQNYLADNDQVTGQPKGFADHIYGVASSARFSDVVTGVTSTNQGGKTIYTYNYSTVLTLTEGPGHDYTTNTYSNAITGIDVTHPYPGRTGVTDVYGHVYNFTKDNNYVPGAPVSILWRYPRTFLSWSIPAMAGYSNETTPPPSGFLAPFGSGVDPTSTAISNHNAYLSYVDAADGSTVSTTDTLTTAAANWLVGNQAFAHTVFWQRGSTFKENNAATEIVQADLNGHIWTKTCGLTGPGGLVTSAFNTITDTNGNAAPFYYSPAVSVYKTSSGVKYDLYAFASGAFYEKSLKINGPNTGTTGFVPAAYIKAVKLDADNNPVSTSTWSVNLKALTGSNSTQVLASPVLVMSGADHPFALFLLYDPQKSNTCAGESYILEVDFVPDNLTGTTTSVTDAGEGAAGGFTISARQVYVSHSGVGQNATPTLGRAGQELNIGPGTLPRPNWWIELQ